MEKKRIRRNTLSMMTRHRIASEAGRAPAASKLGRAKGKDATALSASVGAQIRALRRTADLTAVELARLAHISSGMLSKVEHGGTFPSFATLVAIADALEVPVARLFASFGDRRDLSVVKDGEGIIVDRHGTKKGFTYELLGHLLSGEIFVEPYLITLTETAGKHASFQHTGVEFVHIISGRMTYRYGERLIDACAGDALLYDANAVHGPEDVIDGPVSYLSVSINMRT
jgi:transcriptional regulator with XRE-family HTH domain